MLGAFAFIPFYFQDVHGDQSIISGLKIVPMVAGVMLSSISVGIYISKTGKYIIFPTVGMAVFSTGIGLLMLMNENSSYDVQWIYLFVVGAGMGMTFPVFNAIVQNSVPPKDMASSISATTFLRSIGGSIGVAIFGNVLNQVYNSTYNGNNYKYAYCQALKYVFLSALVCALVSFVLAFGIKNVNLFTRKPKKDGTSTIEEIEEIEKATIAIETHALAI